MRESRRDRRWMLLCLGLLTMAGGGLCRAEIVSVRADDGTVVCSLSLPPGWELMTNPRAAAGTGGGLWTPRDATSLWGVPIGENGGGNSICHRSKGVFAGLLTLGAASSAAEALGRLEARVPGLSAVEVSLSGAARRALEAKGLQFAAYESEGEPMILVLGRPGQRWVALMMLKKSGGPAQPELEELLAQP